MKDNLGKISLIVVAILAAGALLNLAASFSQTKPLADYITKGYGAI